jgi:hypothetical protein
VIEYATVPTAHCGCFCCGSGKQAAQAPVAEVEMQG